MKRFFLLITAVLLSVFTNIQGVVPSETTHSNIAVSYNDYIISGVSDIFHHVANNENVQPTLPQLFPTISKFRFAGFSVESETGINREREISKYIVYAECHILRFEGPDIIYPFNYFW